MKDFNSALENKLIIYDNNCKVCTSLKELLIFLAPSIENRVVSYKSLSGTLVSKINHDRFRNEMALIDLGSKETLYGPEGIAYIFSSKSRLISFLFAVGFIRNIFVFLYRTLAYNRYCVALPKSKFACDCYPDRIFTYRISFIAITYSLSLILTAMFGISLRGFFPEISAYKAALEMLLMAGTGWGIQIVLAMLLLKENLLDYFAHLGTVMVVGLLILVPSMLFQAVFGLNILWAPVLSVVISSLVMLYLHIHRVRFLGMSPLWNFSWLILLQSAAAFWIYTFHFNF